MPLLTSSFVIVHMMMPINLDATELLNYNKSEERKMEEMMEGIAATGVKAGTSLNTH